MPERYIWGDIFWFPIVSRGEKFEVSLRKNDETKSPGKHEDEIRGKGRKCGALDDEQALFLRNRMASKRGN